MTREHYAELLKQLDGEILAMGDLVVETIGMAVDALGRRDVELARHLIEADNEIDKKRYDIERDALLLIATQQPLAGDLRNIAAILTVATELERIADYGEGIARLTLRMASEPVVASIDEIRSMIDLTQRLLTEVLEAFRDRDLETAARVWSRDDEVDEIYEQVFRRLIAEMIENPSTVRAGTYLLWVAHNIERMADRVTNIAERVAFVVTGDVAAFRDSIRAQTLPT